MSASPKSKRAQPERRFEDYVLTYEAGPGAGLFPIDSKLMQYVPKGPTTIWAPYPNYSAGVDGCAEGEAQISLGFSVEIDGIVYKDLYVTTFGWALLIDPTRTTLDDFSEVLSGLPYDPEINSTFSYNHILLAPWFSRMQNVFRTTSSTWVSLSANTYLSDTGWPGSVDDLKLGRYSYPNGIDNRHGGVKFYRGSGGNGPYVVVRWKSFADYGYQMHIAHMDLVIYASGKIEFRYSPMIRDFNDYSVSNAAVGIFSSGPSFYADRYRDFGYTLRKDANDSRGQYVYGGAVYDGVFTDSGQNYITTLKYYERVNPASAQLTSNWPGNDEFGAIFRFIPPQNRRRQNRSIVQLRDSTPFAGGNQESFFDDQLSIPFTVQSIQYPTMLPDTFRVSVNSPDSAAINELFTSSSISVERTVTPGLFDSVLSDAIVEGRKKRSE